MVTQRSRMQKKKATILELFDNTKNIYTLLLWKITKLDTLFLIILCEVFFFPLLFVLEIHFSWISCEWNKFIVLLCKQKSSVFPVLCTRVVPLSEFCSVFCCLGLKLYYFFITHLWHVIVVWRVVGSSLAWRLSFVPHCAQTTSKVQRRLIIQIKRVIVGKTNIRCLNFNHPEFISFIFWNRKITLQLDRNVYTKLYYRQCMKRLHFIE